MPYERIDLDRRVCNGKPIIRGTRIPVVVILERISEGNPWEKILADYPELTREDFAAGGLKQLSNARAFYAKAFGKSVFEVSSADLIRETKGNRDH